MTWQSFTPQGLAAEVLVMDGWTCVVWQEEGETCWRWMAHRTVPTEGHFDSGKAAGKHEAQCAAMEAVPALRKQLHEHAAEGVTL